MCRSCSLTIVTELAHEMENGRSLPVLCLIFSMTHCEICNVSTERGERREGGRGRGGESEKIKWGCTVKEVKMEETESKKRGWVQSRRDIHVAVLCRNQRIY